MVKTGETYNTEEGQIIEDLIISNADARARAVMSPCQSLLSLLTAVQSQLWDFIKMNVKGFVQGVSMDEFS